MPDRIRVRIPGFGNFAERVKQFINEEITNFLKHFDEEKIKAFGCKKYSFFFVKKKHE